MNDGPRIAVYSDVHGNVQGLEAVLDDIQRIGPFDQIVAAGDHCLNGPEPARALDLVMESATAVLYGNTDRDIVHHGSTDPDLGKKKSASIEWTREQLGPERLQILDGLDFEFAVHAPDGSRLLVVHANPHDVDRHIFPDMDDDELRVLIGEVDAAALAFGHLHIPFTRYLDGVMLANIASAGAPRDGDQRAAWGAFSWDEATGWSVETRRVDYDMDETVRRIHASGMPNPDVRAEDVLRATYE
jgi:predicted phosphodiesterase